MPSNVEIATSRLEYDTICNLIEEGSRVLDLGCGGGELLLLLRRMKNVINGIGVEKADTKIYECIERGIAVHQGDIDVGLADYPDQSFDYVILSETLQEVQKPSLVIEEMLRVGKKGILTFPNFGYWRIRWQVLITGSTPMTTTLPHSWHETPNVQFLSIHDFQEFCNEKEYVIEESRYFCRGKRINFWPNLQAESALFVISNPHMLHPDDVDDE